jgi:3-methyladenine DNA glycosylase AlkD
MSTSLRYLRKSLETRLNSLANEKSRLFWERYLKGAIPFRGVPMGSIRKSVHTWWREDGPSELTLRHQKSLALQLFDGTPCEDKLAGTLVLEEILLNDLTKDDIDSFGALFERGLIADWNTCDWFCVKVLGNLAARDLPSPEFTDAILDWRTAQSLWQRRASNVAFVNLAKQGDVNFEGFTHRMLETCAITVRSPERFAQTGVGWLLRELAEADRAAVLRFTRKHLSLLSREALKSIFKHLPKGEFNLMLREYNEVHKVRRNL